MSLFANLFTTNEMVWQTARCLKIVKTSYGDDWKNRPPDVAPQMSAFIAGRQHVRTFYKETSSLPDTLTQIAALDTLGDLPVMVISADK